MLGNNRGRDYDVLEGGEVVVSVRYLTPTEPSDCCMCGRSTFDHFAVPYYCGPVRSGKSEGGYAPACRRCYDRWARWDDAMEEYDSWLALLRAQASRPVCGNCDTAVPPGCGGIFRDDGAACALNRADGMPGTPNDQQETRDA